MKTVFAKKETVKHAWYVVDADGQTLGRLASRIASVLRGKHKVDYTPNVDNGDFVIVVNAGKVKLTGRKDNDKMYHHHTGWAGHLNSWTAGQLRESEPTALVELAVRRMLPKGTLGKDLYKKLKVYAAADHPHAAQQPAVFPF